MSAKNLRKLGAVLLIMMLIAAVIHAKFFGGYKDPEGGLTILYAITTVLGIGGFASLFVARLKSPS